MHMPDPEVSSPTPDPGDPTTAPLAPHASPPLRGFLLIVGTLALVIGVVGIVVPLLPTTPFLLLAAACYSRASSRLYAWLLERRALGPIITEWRTSRSLPPGARVRALAVVALSFGASILLVDVLVIKVALAVAGLGMGALLYRIPMRP
jgi:uncharacterized membrane protein YbaN (DUF454 family)